MQALEPLQIVELRQPRCGLRFGTLPCRAALRTGQRRTNFLRYSQAGSNAVWTKSGVTVADSAAAAPDVTMTAIRLRETAATSNHQILQSLAVVAGQEWTVSAYVKADGRDFCYINLLDAAFGANSDAKFNLAAGTTDRAYATIEPLAGGWFRISLTFTAIATGATNFVFGLSSAAFASVTATYAGDITRGILIWGMQAELGAQVSTYKATLGVPVSALWGEASARCYQTWGSCGSKIDYAPGGRMRWRFVQNRPGLPDVGDFGDPDDVATPAIPVSQLNVGTSQAELNVAGILEGKSAFGVSQTCTVVMPDFVWDDAWGDFYKGLRGALAKRMFWAVWTARNQFFGGMELVIYDGYVGDTLAAMRQRLYMLDGVDGPDGSGKVTLRGVSPLMLADAKRSLFPPAMTMTLVEEVALDTMVIRVTTEAETDLSREMGISSYKVLKIGSEMIAYSGYTVVSPGVYDVAVLVRGEGATTIATAAVNARVQRVGFFEDVETWRCGQYLLGEWTPVTAARINAAMWEDEGSTYLPIFRSRVYVDVPSPVVGLMGEICQQGMFGVWYDEYAQLVQMRAVRPPRGAVLSLTGATGILADTAVMRREPESLLTRVLVYYGPRDVLKLGAGNEANYLNISGQIETFNEAEQAAGGPRVLQIFARWVQTEAHAYQIISRILMRYRDVPRFLSVHVSAKDRTLTIGDVCEVLTREIVTTEGALLPERWEVISWREVRAGEVYFLDLQTFQLVGRFGNWMADGSPDYDVATEAERATGAWWSDDDGLMGDGTPGYQWQ
jgi:hypothetical protein